MEHADFQVPEGNFLANAHFEERFNLKDAQSRKCAMDGGLYFDEALKIMTTLDLS